MDLILSATLIAGFVCCASGISTAGCPSPQYLEYGKEGIIHCFFHLNFYAVLWYDSTDTDLTLPFLKLIGSSKSGQGYDSGQYDVYQNGSLIIKNVSSTHDQTFTVLEFVSATEDQLKFDVNVTTIVMPKQDHPVIDVCGSNLSLCYKKLDDTSTIGCFVRDIRPAIHLHWLERTAEGDRKILFARNMTHHGITFTTYATTSSMFQYSSLLSLLVCKAESPARMLLEDEAFVLIENSDITSNKKPMQTLVERRSQLRLSCLGENPDLIVWKRWDASSDSFVILAYASLLQDNFSVETSEGYEIDLDGSLLVPDVHLNQEGMYECSSDNGIAWGKSLHNVVIRANDQRPSSNRRLLWLLVIPLCCLLAIVVYVYRFQKRQRHQKEKADKGSDQVVPMNLQETDSFLPDSKFQAFLKELKDMYEIQYGSVQLPKTKRCVNDVFMDLGYQLLTSSSNGTDPNSWEYVKTYKELMQRIGNPSMVVIEGGVGCGKTTLSLQLAYDWCNSIENSPVNGNDILILLKVRDIGGETSVFKAIREHILSRDSTLSVKNIQDLLSTCRSGVIILDGFDESMNLINGKKSDIMSIIRGEMFHKYLVLITTRSFDSLTKFLPPHSHRVTIADLDEETKDQYIRKVVVTSDSLEIEKIKQCLYNVSIVTELLKIPLLFTTSAHMSVQDGGFRNFRFLSRIIKFMIDCLHDHLGKKMMKEFGNGKTVKSYKKKHKELDDIAFKIASGQRRPSWNKNKFCKKVGKEFYLYYNRVGLLVENANPNLGTIKPVREVQFSHKLFCDWYAAHCLVKKLEESELEFQEIEKTVQFFDIRNVCQFACGISGNFAKQLTSYLLESRVCENFASLCYLESGKGDEILNAVEQLVASEVTLTNNQNKLLSWSTIQLLTIASQNKFPIARLHLKSCKSPMKFSEGVLNLQDDICLPKMATLKQLVFSEFLDMQTKDEMHILEYSSMCQNIESVMFYHCTVAKTLQDSCLSALKSRDVKVSWATANSTFYMNLQSGIWEHGGTPLSDDEYSKQIDGILHHSGGEQPP